MIKLINYRGSIPWISYDAIKFIEHEIKNRPCKVLEFGSGMSTVWFAKNSIEIYSVENNAYWYKEILNKLSKFKGNNIEYKLIESRDEYSKFAIDKKNYFDVMLVDGPWRKECLENHLDSVKSTGIIYLDNTDANSSSGDLGEIDDATKVLLKFAQNNNANVTHFTDFSPGCLFVTEGLLVKLPQS